MEDGSPDNTLEVCKHLEKEYEKVKLFNHPGNVNKGAGAARRIFFNDEKVDGIYEAIDRVYYSSIAKKIFEKKSHPELLTAKKILIRRN